MDITAIGSRAGPGRGITGLMRRSYAIVWPEILVLSPCLVCVGVFVYALIRVTDQA